jgi:hypothetical protein
MSQKTETKQGWKWRTIKNQTEKGEKLIKLYVTKKWKKANKKEKIDKKAIKEKELKIKVLSHELLASTLFYLMVAPWWYYNLSNLSSQTPSIPSLVLLCLSNYRSVLFPHDELVPLRASVEYVQTMFNMSKPSQMMLQSSSSTSTTLNISRMSLFRTWFLVWP